MLVISPAVSGGEIFTTLQLLKLMLCLSSRLGNGVTTPPFATIRPPAICSTSLQKTEGAYYTANVF